MKYLVILEQDPESYGVMVPDLPGCFSGGETLDEALRDVGEAISLWLETNREQGGTDPEPSFSRAEFVEVNIPAAAQSS